MLVIEEHVVLHRLKLSGDADSENNHGGFLDDDYELYRIQRTLVEAAKLAPRQSHELAVIYDKEKQKGNGNRATLAVARKMVAYLLAVDRQQRVFIPDEERRTAAA